MSQKQQVEKETDERIKDAEKQRMHLKEAKKLVKALQRLRDLRREKEKARGRFFPEEDHHFGKKIREAEDLLHDESKKYEKVVEAEREARKARLAAEGSQRDPLKEHYLQAERNLESLIDVRSGSPFFFFFKPCFET